MKTLSLTARISLLFAVAASLVLLVTGVILTRAVESHFAEGDRHELEGKLELIRHLLERVDGEEAMEHLRLELDNALVGHHGLTVAVMNARGEVWFASAGADFPPVLLREQACGQAPDSVQCAGGPLRQWHRSGRDFRGMVAPVRAGDGQSHTVAVALDIGHHHVFMLRFRIMLAVAMALAALATAALGWFATRRGLAPLRQVRDLAAGISAERLATRLPEAGLPAELQTLADAFNAMLARLADSFRRLSEFSSDIAHELRTPISNLMTQTQVALSGARSAEEYREVLYSSLEEYERMAQMVGDMLYLAKTENGLLAPALAQVDLDAEVRGLLEYFEPWAEEAGVALKSSGAARVRGDRLMLRRAMSNLISNAVRHTPAGGSVEVSLETRGEWARVSVANPGLEIPPEHLPRLFDRFYLIDASRQRKGEGAGLGLAIVKSIVEAHGGAISVTSIQGKTTFRVELPLAGQG